MKQLLIARHGKSSWDFDNISDIDRPLSARGVENACMMAGRLLDKQIIPDLLISSPAIRAASTALIFMRVLNLSWTRIRFNEAIYSGYADEIAGIIRSIDNGFFIVMLFGHNPALTTLVNKYLLNGVDNIPTAGIVSMTFETDSWSEFDKKQPVNEFIDYPKRV